MSWLVRSLAAPFQDHEDEKSEGEGIGERSPTEREAGVKEDLSQLKNALKKQLWGVASFIAPPPQISTEKSLDNDQDEIQEMDGTRNESDGIRTDLSQLSGQVRSGFSRFSTALQSLTTDEVVDEVEDSSSPALNFPASFSSGITEISKLASSFLPLNSGRMKAEGEARVVGLTDEVRIFAASISQHPGTWLDFPLDDGDDEDFDMSDVQQEHALAVERLTPNLASLRLELCPDYMSDGQFWKIYFVLLHPQLSKEDALLLTTPQILEARALLSEESQKRNKAKSIHAGRSLGSPERNILLMPQEQNFEHFPPVADSSEKAESFKSVSLETMEPLIANNSEGDYHNSSQRDLSNHVASTEDVEHDDEDADVDNWLQEEPGKNDASVYTATGLSNEEDVSFSDLEDDDDTQVQTDSAKNPK
jgi:hypothetical protein